jgi:hypothetical protein
MLDPVPAPLAVSAGTLQTALGPHRDQQSILGASSGGASPPVTFPPTASTPTAKIFLPSRESADLEPPGCARLTSPPHSSTARFSSPFTRRPTSDACFFLPYKVTGCRVCAALPPSSYPIRTLPPFTVMAIRLYPEQVMNQWSYTSTLRYLLKARCLIRRGLGPSNTNRLTILT